MKFKLPRKWTRMLLSGVGLILFVYLILRIGVGVVLENISRFGVWFAVILFVGACWLFFQACAWTIIQNAYFQKVGFFRLFRIRIISDALNILLPSASLGGDAARAYLIKGNVPLKEGIPSVLFDKTIEFVASTIFLAAGLLVGTIFIRMPEGLQAPTLICLAITTIGLVLLIFFPSADSMGSFSRSPESSPRSEDGFSSGRSSSGPWTGTSGFSTRGRISRRPPLSGCISWPG